MKSTGGNLASCRAVTSIDIFILNLHKKDPLGLCRNGFFVYTDFTLSRVRGELLSFGHKL